MPLCFLLKAVRHLESIFCLILCQSASVIPNLLIRWPENSFGNWKEFGPDPAKLYGLRQVKMCLQTCIKWIDSDQPMYVQYHPGLCSPFIHSVVSNDSDRRSDRRSDPAVLMHRLLWALAVCISLKTPLRTVRPVIKSSDVRKLVNPSNLYKVEGQIRKKNISELSPNTPGSSCSKHCLLNELIMVKMLTVLVSKISNSQVFLLKKCK